MTVGRKLRRTHLSEIPPAQQIFILGQAYSDGYTQQENDHADEVTPVDDIAGDRHSLVVHSPRETCRHSQKKYDPVDPQGDVEARTSQQIIQA